jgi:hypothetical protein
MDKVKEYTGYSSIAGLVYVAKEGTAWSERLLWSIVLVVLVSLGFYWSWILYEDWAEKPVLTYVRTTGKNF